MFEGGRKRYIPLVVRQALRSEAHFGCAECGNPILEYHHIIPWAVQQHNDPDHMVAVCPLHHAELEKRPQAHAYALKENPHNKKLQIFRGMLYTKETTPCFVLGGNFFENTPVIFSYFKFPILEYTIKEGQNLVSAYIPSENFSPEIKIIENEVVANSEGFWDIEFSTNYLRFRKIKGQVFFELDFRSGKAEVSANLEILGQNFKFSSNETNLGGTTIKGNTISGCATGIAYGHENMRVFPPNFAMRFPKVIFS